VCIMLVLLVFVFWLWRARDKAFFRSRLVADLSLIDCSVSVIFSVQFLLRSIQRHDAGGVWQIGIFVLCDFGFSISGKDFFCTVWFSLFLRHCRAAKTSCGSSRLRPAELCNLETIFSKRYFHSFIN
jgi:hypothetical protein